MTSIDLGFGSNWVPDACTLPTVEQPLRQAEFDNLFTSLVGVDRTDVTRATLTFAGAAELASTAQDLADRETACCSFFAFTITPDTPRRATQEAVHMSIAVPKAHAAVLAALVERAEQQAGR
jgi:hypothetical protein